ncbi:MAG: RNA 2',3'-cyclic phosphodiesterase [Deltaproteobacteria bacterium]|nr:RNA 2',3'-cyclic phosphodiesterase [Deltaproteobacteria bacterium]
MAKTQRTFIAVHFSVEIIDALARCEEKLKIEIGSRAKIKWVAPKNIHMTLQFLSEVDVELLPLLAEELNGAFSKITPFEVEINGIGAFPTPTKPRVIWAGITAGQSGLQALFDQVHRVTEPLGFEREKRDFRPHVTLGRIRDPRKSSNISRELDKFANHWLGKCQIALVGLMASELNPGGPIYTTLDSFPLGE